VEDKAEPAEPRALPDRVAAPISGSSSMMQIRLAGVFAGSFAFKSGPGAPGSHCAQSFSARQRMVQAEFCRAR
jgi:hypothetical protein